MNRLLLDECMYNHLISSLNLVAKKWNSVITAVVMKVFLHKIELTKFKGERHQEKQHLALHIINEAQKCRGAS